MLDVPRELVRHLSRLLAWFRNGGDKTLLGAGFGISRATAYRYLAKGITVTVLVAML